jgi:hypothetical protein
VRVERRVRLCSAMLNRYVQSPSARPRNGCFGNWYGVGCCGGRLSTSPPKRLIDRQLAASEFVERGEGRGPLLQRRRLDYVHLLLRAINTEVCGSATTLSAAVRLALAISAVLLATALASEATEMGAVSKWPTAGWRASTPEEHGMDVGALFDLWISARATN